MTIAAEAAAAAGGRVLVAGGYDVRAPGVAASAAAYMRLQCSGLFRRSSKDNTRDVDTVEHLDPWQSIGCAPKNHPSTLGCCGRNCS